MPAELQPALTIERGVCHVLYAFDIGLAVELEQAAALLKKRAGTFRPCAGQRNPKYFDYSPAPLRLAATLPPQTVGGVPVGADASLVLYDYGGLSIRYELPIAGGLDALHALSCTLSLDTALLADARRLAQALLDAIRAAVQRPSLSESAEDYIVFEADEYIAGCEPEEFHRHFAQPFAQLLRASTRPLSGQEVEDALACRISCERDDVSFIDWNAALVFDRDADDVRAVLEFANSELQEMRLLDRELDHALDRAYAAVTRSGRFRRMLPGSEGGRSRRIARMQMDAAVLFERVSNAPKLLGDQYLARVYRLAAQRFHLPEWNATALRKLDALGTIYKQMHDRAASWRLEMLEWIIVVMIGFEIVMSFVRK